MSRAILGPPFPSNSTSLNSSDDMEEYPDDYKIFWGYTVDVWFPLYIAVILLYIYILYVLMTTKSAKLKSPFFQMFLIIGIIDVIDAIAVEYIRFSQRVGMGPKFGWLLQITTAITGHNFCSHLVGNTLMSLFQFTAVWLPFLHERIWTRKYTYIMMLLTFAIPLGVYSHLYFTNFMFKIDDTGKWVYVKRFDPITKTRILDSVVTIVQTVLCIVMLGAVVIGIRIKTADSFKRLIPEKSLVFVEIVKVTFGLMQAMYGIIFLFDIPLHNPILEFIFNEFVSYFFFLVTLNAITLPLVSGTFRKEMKRRWWKSDTTVTFISTADISSHTARKSNR